MPKKDLIIHGTLVLLGIILMIIIFILGLLPNQIQKSPKPLGFEKINDGFENAIYEQQTRIITSTDQWIDLWAEMFPDGIAAPEINLNEKKVIAVFQGQKPTGGYSVIIESITEYQDYIEIGIKDIYPGLNCIVKQEITSPYTTIAIKNSKKEIRFFREEQKQNC